MQIKNLYNYWFPVIFYAFLIFFLSSMPQPGLKVYLFPASDKVLHFIEYGVFGFLLIRAFSFSQKHKKVLYIRILVLLVAVIYAASDEIHQHFVFGRSAEFLDFASDAAGAWLGQVLFKLK